MADYSMANQRKHSLSFLIRIDSDGQTKPHQLKSMLLASRSTRGAIRPDGIGPEFEFLRNIGGDPVVVVVCCQDNRVLLQLVSGILDPIFTCD